MLKGHRDSSSDKALYLQAANPDLFLIMYLVPFDPCQGWSLSKANVPTHMHKEKQNKKTCHDSWICPSDCLSTFYSYLNNVSKIRITYIHIWHIFPLDFWAIPNIVRVLCSELTPAIAHLVPGIKPGAPMCRACTQPISFIISLIFALWIYSQAKYPLMIFISSWTALCFAMPPLISKRA